MGIHVFCHAAAFAVLLSASCAPESLEFGGERVDAAGGSSGALDAMPSGGASGCADPSTGGTKGGNSPSGCPARLTSVFCDDFTTPSGSIWASGSDVQINTSQWSAYTRDNHSARIHNGQLEIRSGRKHGQGYAYVHTVGADAAYHPALYTSTLKGNSGAQLEWSFNMQRDNPLTSSAGGFDCASISAQNDRTVGLAYVLATDSAAGLDADPTTCNASATSRGYAVTFGGVGPKVRLIRFVNGLRNGTLTTLVESGTINSEHYLSARVTYNSINDQWQLEARSDGSTGFKDPSSGTYAFIGTAVDATYVGLALDFAGAYLQTGCTGLCDGEYTARFDNVRVGTRCAE